MLTQSPPLPPLLKPRWDFFGGKKVDLDAQALCFDSIGNLVDAAYYNQLEACNGAIKHSGDNRSGEGEGFDESIDLDVDLLATSHVEFVAIVVTAYSGGSFFDVETATAVLQARRSQLPS